MSQFNPVAELRNKTVSKTIRNILYRITVETKISIDLKFCKNQDLFCDNSKNI